MKKILLIIIAAFIGTNAFCQIEKPVTWSFALKKEKNNEAVILLKASIKSSWHIYSLDQKEGGPVKTTITFLPAAGYTLIGRSSQPQPQTKFEKAFNMKVSYFENTVVFQQRIKLKPGKGTLHGKLEYMTCNNQKCLPPEDLDFTINL
ncbi:protein-disulfide reductase DsbD family protein [Mucilaginibacter sabulilitoris]|uniref:Protein-disulfide reductase DsbD family protein n=1 Tax=Mucilaginibacter sabulilitoris TaxID=1173583 RepID=A0ABZ0TQI1_9SPHI|nr:protein-disulfide reductase DsbD domain-containing protein [Mucilaginibacter sabulilitoris]WPU94717.1 protein-disulfide reductase DsbD family protein [Mucilaginibacter sabulilitoris]